MAMADALQSAHCVDTAQDAVSTLPAGREIGRRCGWGRCWKGTWGVDVSENEGHVTCFLVRLFSPSPVRPLIVNPLITTAAPHTIPLPSPTSPPLGLPTAAIAAHPTPASPKPPPALVGLSAALIPLRHFAVAVSLCVARPVGTAASALRPALSLEDAAVIMLRELPVAVRDLHDTTTIGTIDILWHFIATTADHIRTVVPRGEPPMELSSTRCAHCGMDIVGGGFVGTRPLYTTRAMGAIVPVADGMWWLPRARLPVVLR